MPTEAVIPVDVVHRLLRNAGNELVLVGGQSLAFWMDRYDVSWPETEAAVTRDIDFLVKSPVAVEHVERLAHVLGGRAIVYPPEALTALVGQAVRDIGNDEYLNVDVIFKIFGGKTDVVHDAALDVEFDGVELRVMHPIDMLKSRVDNLHGLKQKQTPLGDAQLRAAILVVRRFQHEVVDLPHKGTRHPLLGIISAIEKIALSSAGRKVASRRGIHVADAIEPRLVDHDAFRSRRLPQLRSLMSPQRLLELGELSAEPTRQ